MEPDLGRPHQPSSGIFPHFQISNPLSSSSPVSSAAFYANAANSSPTSSTFKGIDKNTVIDWKNGVKLTFSVELSEGMSAKVDLPVTGEYGIVFVDGKKAEAKLIDNRWVLPDEVSGTVRIVVK
jgi:hypothetical protein